MAKLNDCLIPGCTKKIVKEGYLFCGEHERMYREFAGGVGKYGLLLVTYFVTSVIRTIKK